ncbi:MAG TPA: ATP-binding protein, partial [Pyrinomonadaceae bacterium]
AYLRSFIRAGYRLSDAESHELDREGNRKYIVNNLIGVIEHGRLLRAWGTQRDITKRKQAEERLRYQLELNSTITSNAAEALFLLDAEWRTTFVNPAAEEIFGWKREEFLGKNLHELVHYRRPDGTPFPISECPIGAVFKQGQTVREHEDIFIRKDGTFIPVSYSNAPIIVNGQVTGAVLTVHDITERRQAEAALRVADQRALAEYERLIERINNLAQSLGTARDLLTIFRALREFALLSVPCIGIFISLYDPQRDVRTCAYGWGDGIEFDVSELPPMPITSTGPNSVAVRTGEVIITDDYISATRGHPSVVVGPDNGLRPQSSLVVPMAVMSRIIGTIEVQSYERAAYRAEHSTALLMAANLAAIAVENVRLLEHESRARAVAEESNRMKDEFLATVSHELRTPLTSILGWSNMLSTGLLDEATARVALETIERNARAQAQIIDDILDVSRIITGKLILDVKPVELGPVIEAAINAVRPAANAKSIQLETLFDTGVGPVPGDASRLQQVVWNLLSNAVKFTPRGGRVLVSLRQTPNNIEISVSDTGPGISPEFLPFVFERFRQADSTTTRRHGGLGLGLAIVRHMVELHGGTVQAESKSEGEGANFTVKLPLACAVPDALSAEAATREGATDLSSPWSNRSLLEGVHVLLVDDDQDTLTVLSAILERRLMKVTAVNSANAAIEALESSRPHILVADIGMPEIDGYELIRRIRTLSSEQGGNIPAVALTAYAREDDRQRSLDAGYQQHLSKPVDPSELLATISLLTKRSGKISGNGNNDS